MRASARDLTESELAMLRGQRFPLDVYAYIARACFDSDLLHYGFFEHPDENLVEAQQRATATLVAWLPPQARLLEVGTGFGALLAQLAVRGHEVTGITPEAGQYEQSRQRVPLARLWLGTFEQFAAGGGRFDAVLFQESAQYIAAQALWSGCELLVDAGGQVLVADEFLRQRDPVGSLHLLGDFIAAARQHGFVLVRQIDAGRYAAPTLQWIKVALQAARGGLQRQLGIGADAIDGLLASAEALARAYADGRVTYALLDFRREPAAVSHRFAT